MKTKHVIVLMLENRSFDHMLGFLKHPSTDYPRIKAKQFTNEDEDSVAHGVNARATRRLVVGPGHHFEDVNEQTQSGKEMSGFVRNYQKRLKNKIRSAERKLSSLENAIQIDSEKLKTRTHLITSQDIAQSRYRLKNNKRKKQKLNAFLQLARGKNYHARAMHCFNPDTRIPVLATLAREFCVFTNWFCSVPGMTWPNRAFAHAATSNGEVNIKPGFYYNRTIFEDLTAAGKSWAVYHDGPTHLWVYPKLWSQKGDNFRKLKNLFRDLQNSEDADNPLPDYIFVEPNHGLKLGPISAGHYEDANSQHPKNNTSANIDDFIQAEELIAEIYRALKSNYGLFKQTLFLLTYDEHGGFFDHVVPPANDIPAPDNKTRKFKFDRLGVRVPAVLISPWIKKGTVDDNIYDHSSIVKTVRNIFIPGTRSLTKRDKWARPFNTINYLDNPRTQLPDVIPKSLKKVLKDEKIKVADYRKDDRLEKLNQQTNLDEKNELQNSLIDLAANVEKVLNERQTGTVSQESVISWNKECCSRVRKRVQTDIDLGNYMESIAGRVRTS